MPHKMFWYHSDQVLYVQMWGNVDEKALGEIDRELISAFESSQQPQVHQIYDMRGLKSLPHLNTLQAMSSLGHAKGGSSALFGVSTAIQFVVNLLAEAQRLERRKLSFKTCKDITESCAWLKEREPALAELPCYSLTEMAEQLYKA